MRNACANTEKQKETNMLKKNDPCPKCGGKIEWDMGDSGSYWEPPTAPWIACSKCDYEPDENEIDYDSFNPYQKYDKQ